MQATPAAATAAPVGILKKGVKKAVGAFADAMEAAGVKKALTFEDDDSDVSDDVDATQPVGGVAAPAPVAVPVAVPAAAAAIPPAAIYHVDFAAAADGEEHSYWSLKEMAPDNSLQVFVSFKAKGDPQAEDFIITIPEGRDGPLTGNTVVRQSNGEVVGKCNAFALTLSDFEDLESANVQVHTDASVFGKSAPNMTFTVGSEYYVLNVSPYLLSGERDREYAGLPVWDWPVEEADRIEFIHGGARLTRLYYPEKPLTVYNLLAGFYPTWDIEGVSVEDVEEADVMVPANDDMADPAFAALFNPWPGHVNTDDDMVV